MREPSPPAPELLLGPLLRYAGTENATFWVETSAPCDVEILGHKARTFNVEGHHYALVVANDLEPASVTPYDVRLDGRLVWPPRDDGRPQPVVHTRNHEHRARLVFGSCRVGGPPPTRLTEPWPEDLREIGIDALWTYSKQLQRGEAEWPDALLLLGDQVYADEVSPATLEFIESRRDTTVAPGRGNRRLRGIHPPLPRVVGRSRDSLAVVDRAHSDDLRRPRRPRRLEHVVALGAGNAVEALVGGPDRRCLHVVLDLPAPGQSVATRARGRDDVPARARGRGRGPPAPPIRRDVRPRVRFMPVGVLSRLRQHPLARRRLAGGARAGGRQTGDGRRGGVGLDRRSLGRLLRPCRHREHAPDLPSSRDSPPRGVERGPLQRPLGSVGRVDQRATPTRDRPRALGSLQRVLRAPMCLAAHRSRRAEGTISPPPRSCCSAATSTTHTSARSSSTRTRAAASTSSCARHSGTLYLQGSAASCG